MHDVCISYAGEDRIKGSRGPRGSAGRAHVLSSGTARSSYMVLTDAIRVWGPARDWVNLKEDVWLAGFHTTDRAGSGRVS